MDDLIPIERVLDDMYSDSYIAYSAREYYYQHYADDAQKKIMDRENKVRTFFGALLFVASAISIVASAILSVQFKSK